MANSKAQQLDRTLVTEFLVQVADLRTRVRQLKGSMAAKIPSDANFFSGDATVDANTPFDIVGVKTAVIVHCYSPGLLLSIAKDNGLVQQIECDGLFMFYGKLDRIIVSANAPLRFTYLYA